MIIFCIKSILINRYFYYFNDNFFTENDLKFSLYFHIDFIIILNSSYYIESILINRYFNYYYDNFFIENGFSFA